jgi:3-oxo-5alpha-steroid 4-dehydrogenase
MGKTQLGHADFEYDVIVVGFGVAGVCAAIAAAESGTRVLAVDRGLGGGGSALSGGVVYAGGGTPYQKAAGHDEVAENMFNYLQQEVAGAVKDGTLRRFCDSSVEQLAWLEKHGAQFASSLCPYKTSYPTDRHYLYYSGNEKAYPYTLHAFPAPRGHRQVAKGMSSGRVLWERLRDSAVALGVTFLPMTRVDDLVIEGGRVCGVRCRTMVDDCGVDARLYRRAAGLGAKLTNWLPGIGRRFNRIADAIWHRKAQNCTIKSSCVILAAGGFIYNHDMVLRYAPEYEHTSPLGTIADDGKGILLGVDAGAATANLDRITAWRFLSPPAAMLEGVAVGVNGDRIANEDLYGATFTEIMIRRLGGKGFLILDSEIWKRARSQLWLQTMIFQRTQMAWLFTMGHRKAATLTELAGKLDISAAGLLATVSEYNAAITARSDDPAHKAADLRAPITQEPYYGIDISVRPSRTFPTTALTLGGLRVDEDTGKVLTNRGSRIGGLYAAGRTAVGVCANSYVSGLSLADCVFSGRRAGEHSVTDDRKPRSR